MTKPSFFATTVALGLFFRATVAQADLIPAGGEGVSECRNKKASDACQNYYIDGTELKYEPGTCVEEDLSKIRFKFKAHLRCVSANVPKPAASAVNPLASAIATASASPPETPPSSPSSPVLPTPVDSAKPLPEPIKSSGCAIALVPEKSIALGFVALGLGILLRKRRSIR